MMLVEAASRQRWVPLYRFILAVLIIHHVDPKIYMITCILLFLFSFENLNAMLNFEFSVKKREN
jgi:hypothetical protein